MLFRNLGLMSRLHIMVILLTHTRRGSGYRETQAHMSQLFVDRALMFFNMIHGTSVFKVLSEGLGLAGIELTTLSSALQLDHLRRCLYVREQFSQCNYKRSARA